MTWIKNKFPVELLYIDSFVSCKDVEDYFLSGGKYEKFNRIDRVQDTAEKFGLTIHNKFNHFYYESLDDSLFLMGVNKEFFEGRMSPWRDDHFIAIFSDGVGYRYLNQYPLSEGYVSKKYLEKYFNNQMLVYKYVGNFNFKKYEKEKNKAIEIIKNTYNSIDLLNLEGVTLRDAIGIIKISRGRVLRFLEQAGIKQLDSLSKEVDFLEKNYLCISIDVLRGKSPKYELMLEQVMEMEREWIKII